MEQILLISSFTKKLNLLIIEESNFITTKYKNFIELLFDTIIIKNTQKEAIDIIQNNSIDIIFIDDRLYDEKPFFSYIKTIHNLNPLIKIVGFCHKVDKEFLYKVIEYNLSGCIESYHTQDDLKFVIKRTIENMMLNIKHKFLHEQKIELVDCYKFLLEYKENRVRLVNHYKGIPIIREASIVSYDGNRIEFEIDQVQCSTLSYGTHMVISSEHLGIEILTSVLKIDRYTKSVELEFIDFLQSYVHHRKQPRIEPKKNSYLSLHHKKGVQRLYIYNISIDHVLCEKTDGKKIFEIQESYKVDIDCHLDVKIAGSNNYIIHTKAYIKEIFRADMKDKILFQFELDKYQKSVLESYITYQAKEYILELRDKNCNL